MKAAAYSKAGPPSVLVYQEVPDPICGPRDVLIDVHAISIEGGDVLARARLRQNVQRLIGEVAEGRLQVVVDRSYKLSEAAEAHAYIESRKQFGRVILIPDARA